MITWRRTHTCGELRESHIGQTVTLNGWVNSSRVHNYQVFMDLRDRYGLTQVVFDAQDSAALFAAAEEARNEWVLSVTGKVRARLPGATNPKLATGAIEVEALELRVLNRCPPAGKPEEGNRPFEVNSVPQENGPLGDPPLAGEDLRLTYRYLDLRRPTLQRTLAVRHRLNKVIRDYFDARGFLEIETPLLGRSTPEGARDYLVPSRVNREGEDGPPHWYALPQSPQLYKQLLMVAGYDKYFQIARCLRDEDLRADRQPEFTQLDLEMSFVDQDDVLAVIEGMTAEVFKRCIDVAIPTPFLRLRYEDAMLRYGSDKPDLRYGLEIVELSDLAARMDLPPFRAALAAGGRVRAINVKGSAERFSRKVLDGLAENFKRASGVMLGYVKVEQDKVSSSIAKALTPELQSELLARLEGKPGDLLLLGAACSVDDTAAAMGALRQQLAQHLALVDPAKKEFKIAWVVDFPSFLWDNDEKRWVANHHPFTSPQDDYLEAIRTATEEDLVRHDSKLAAVKAKAYDLVINGYECGGGSIRIHNPEVQGHLFRVLGMSEAQARQRFGFLLDALKYGAPPHGGIALGLDRFTMMLAGTSNIRDVIAFPKNQKARDLMTGAPAAVDLKQLKELGL
jgi:aspartyl-tRNA synthetase